ncbi:MAG TPA: segregation/condensation protein A [Longimicrobiaceae bacterium]|nr:segregation/condensation protein A [Longimicrobiaceae bacterium]
MAPALLDPYAVELERFQGPLDLLLHLIRKQEIDIFDIPISRITEQFLAAIAGAGQLELERAGEFLEMAATLVRIKAQMLFPRRVEEEEDDPRVELVRRLLEWEHFREVAARLELAERARARHRPRGYVEERQAPRATETPLQLEWSEVWQAALRLDERLREQEPGYRVAGHPVRIEEKIELVLAALRHAARVEFSALVTPWGTRMHAVASLLACLELARRNSVRLGQAGPFTSLWVYRRSGEAG